MTDPGVMLRRNELAALGERLVDLESDATVTVARGGGLTGGTRATWAEADAGIAAAWEVYRAVDDLLGRAESDPARAAELLAAPTVPTAAGPCDAATALAAAGAELAAAAAVRPGWPPPGGGLASRVQVASAAALAAGDGPAQRAADAIAGLLVGDPLAVTEADVVHVESLAQAATGRHAAVQSATGRLDLDLERARATLDTLDADVQAAAGELAHAASRIAGVDVPSPARDLPALAGWLDRIAATGGSDQPRQPPPWTTGSRPRSPAGPSWTAPSTPPAPACGAGRRGGACGRRCGPRPAPAASTSNPTWPPPWPPPATSCGGRRATWRRPTPPWPPCRRSWKTAPEVPDDRDRDRLRPARLCRHVVDGYCDTCGMAPSAAPAGRTGSGRVVTRSGRVSGRVDVSA